MFFIITFSGCMLNVFIQVTFLPPAYEVRGNVLTCVCLSVCSPGGIPPFASHNTATGPTSFPGGTPPSSHNTSIGQRSLPDRGYPILPHWGTTPSFLMGGGNPLSRSQVKTGGTKVGYPCQDWMGDPLPSGLDWVYPLSGLDGVPPPPPRRQNRRASTCHVVEGVPLAFTLYFLSLFLIYLLVLLKRKISIWVAIESKHLLLRAPNIEFSVSL